VIKRKKIHEFDEKHSKDVLVYKNVISNQKHEIEEMRDLNKQY